jgi:hypothetical protein
MYVISLKSGGPEIDAFFDSKLLIIIDFSF